MYFHLSLQVTHLEAVGFYAFLYSRDYLFSVEKPSIPVIWAG